MGPREFLALSARLAEAPVVLCVGPSATLAGMALSQLVKGREADVERVGAGDGQLREACELAATPSFFGDAGLVVAWRTQALTGQKGRGEQERALELRALADHMERPPRGATLFVWAPEADGRLAPVRRAVERGWLLPADAGKELGAWLGELARQAGVKLPPQATQAFLASGLDLDSLATALGTAELAMDEGSPITADVAAWAAPPAVELRVFALTDAILQRRPTGVATVLGQLLGQGEAPLGLLALVARQLRQLAAARAELAAGRSAQELAKIIGAHTFVAQKLCQAAPLWSQAGIVAAFRELLRCDLALKSGGSQPLALELGLMRVAGAQF